MTYKSPKSLFKPAKLVKLATMTTLMGLMAQTAQADEGLVKTTTITVKFDAGLLESSEGVEQVYKRLKREAKQACKISNSLWRPYRNVASCKLDLLDQFVDSANKAVLTNYHEAVTKGVVLVAEK